MSRQVPLVCRILCIGRYRRHDQLRARSTRVAVRCGELPGAWCHSWAL